jgi:hypothetical protein
MASQSSAGQEVLDRPWVRATIEGLSWYFLSTLVVVGGILFNDRLAQRDGRARDPRGMVERLAPPHSNAANFAEIAEHGYVQQTGPRSNVAFPPAYPLAARLVLRLLRQSPEWALVATAHAALGAVFVVSVRYLELRNVPRSPPIIVWMLAALAFFPAGLFLRFAYSESLFLLLVLLALIQFRRGAAPAVSALVVGLATATREVGVALLLPWVLNTWNSASTRASAIARVLLLSPLACWGILSWMTYQYFAFGDPLAFVEAHDQWWVRGRAHWTTELLLGLSLEPVLAVYDPTTDAFWGNRTDSSPWYINLRFWNPIVFVGAVALTVLGASKRWLNSSELALSAGLLLVPYFTRGYDMAMSSMSRFVAVAFPIYLVAGHIFARWPPLAAACLAIGGILLAILSGRFADGSLDY